MKTKQLPPTLRKLPVEIMLTAASSIYAMTAAASISGEEFTRLINKTKETFGPVVAQHDAQLIIEGFYESSADVAMATRSRDHKKWFIRMWGGVPKFPNATSDTVTLILCHELGHHLGGYPYYDHDPHEWAATEGQADYWATQACTRLLWENDLEENARFAATPDTRCEASFTAANDINLCKRAYRATELNAPYEGKSSRIRPSIRNRDRAIVRELFTSHPGGQCRVDSMHMGLLCNVVFDFTLIPGRKNPDGQNTIAAELEARSTSCFGKNTESAKSRPLCWFKESVTEKAPETIAATHQSTSAGGEIQVTTLNLISDSSTGEELLPWLIN